MGKHTRSRTDTGGKKGEMSYINYLLHKIFKIPLYTCSGCQKKECEHRVNEFQYPCISWRKYAKQGQK